MESLVGGDAEIDPFDIGLERCAAGGDEDAFGLQLLAGRKLD